VELLIAFRLEPPRMKQFEMEFPSLGKESDFVKLDTLIRSQILESSGESEE
jgi:hypothetical protein